MDKRIEDALDRDNTIDITTIGRRSGRPQRIEIWFKRVDGRTYITGTPGPRDWYANLIANPRFTFHLKQSLRSDLSARAQPIEDEAERRRILSAPVMAWYWSQVSSLDDLIWWRAAPWLKCSLSSEGTQWRTCFVTQIEIQARSFCFL